MADFTVHFTNGIGDVCVMWFKYPNGLRVSHYFIGNSYFTRSNTQVLDLGPVYDRSSTRFQQFFYLPTHLPTYIPTYLPT